MRARAESGQLSRFTTGLRLDCLTVAVMLFASNSSLRDSTKSRSKHGLQRQLLHSIFCGFNDACVISLTSSGALDSQQSTNYN